MTYLYLALSRDQINLTDDALGGRAVWWPLADITEKDRGPGTAATAKHRSDRSIGRRAAYALEQRGLVVTWFTDTYRFPPQVHVRLSAAGIDYVTRHPVLLGRVHAVRRKLDSNLPMLSRAEAIKLFRTPTPLGDAEYYRRCALDELNREIDLDSVDDLSWAFYDYLGFDRVEGTSHPADDDAIIDLARHDVAHPFLTSLILYRSQR